MQILSQKDIKDKGITNQQLEAMSNQNILNVVNWSKLDILISTPTQLELILKLQESQNSEVNNKKLNPKFVVIDELDLLLNEPSIQKSTLYILRKIFGSQREHKDKGLSEAELEQLQQEQQSRKVILTGASLPAKINKQPAEEALEQWFPGNVIVKSERYLKMSKNVELVNYNVESLVREERLQLLCEIIDKEGSENTLVFVEKGEDAEYIAKLLNEQMIPCCQFHAKMNLNQRLEMISDFKRQNYGVMIATDLAARGLDFKEVDLVIQFDYATNATNLLHRIGRTGRFGRKGKVVSMIDYKDQLLFDEFQQLVEKDLPVDSIFSRKRSFFKSDPKPK